LRYISESLLEIVSQVERGFAAESESFVSSKRYISAAQVIQRGLEMCEKLAFHLGKIREVAYDKLKILTELDEETRLFLSAEPLADLFSISGFAIIYSELDGGSFWTTARAWWDSYLGKLPAPEQVLQFFATVREIRHSRLRLLPRDTIRTSWQQDLAARLRGRGVPDDFSPPLERPSPGPDRAQASPIMRLLIRRGGALMVDSEDLFFAVYVSSRRGMEEHLPRRAASLLRTLRGDGFGERRRNPGPEP
jgi:hypothetical protein